MIGIPEVILMSIWYKDYVVGSEGGWEEEEADAGVRV